MDIIIDAPHIIEQRIVSALQPMLSECYTLATRYRVTEYVRSVVDDAYAHREIDCPKFEVYEHPSGGIRVFVFGRENPTEKD